MRQLCRLPLCQPRRACPATILGETHLNASRYMLLIPTYTKSGPGLPRPGETQEAAVSTARLLTREPVQSGPASVLTSSATNGYWSAGAKSIDCTEMYWA